MIAPLNTSQAPPSLMVLNQTTIDGVANKQCSGCRKTGTGKVIKMLADFGDEQHVLVQCQSDRCSWHDAKLHMIYKAPPQFQQTVVVNTTKPAGEVRSIALSLTHSLYTSSGRNVS